MIRVSSAKESNIFTNLGGRNPVTKAIGIHKYFFARHRIPYERIDTAARFVPSNCCDMMNFEEASEQEEVNYSTDRNLECLLKRHRYRVAVSPSIEARNHPPA